MVTPGCEHVHLQPDLPSDHPTLEPRHFIDERVVNEHHHDYMFLECIKFINEVGNELLSTFTDQHFSLTNTKFEVFGVTAYSSRVSCTLIHKYRADKSPERGFECYLHL